MSFCLSTTSWQKVIVNDADVVQSSLLINNIELAYQSWKQNAWSANYDFKNTVMNGLVKPYKIFHKNGLKVGVFGLGIELEGLVDKRMYKETVWNNPVETAQDMVRILKKEQKCDLVICLSHLGYKYKEEPTKICDLKLAELTQDIDLIIGGHTHTFLDKPTIVKNSVGKEVLVNQVGCYGINLGRIDFYLDNDKAKSHEAKSIIV